AAQSSLARGRRALPRVSAFSHGAGISIDLHGERGAADFQRRIGSIPDLKVRLLRGRHRLGSLVNAHTECSYAQRSGNFNGGQAVLRRKAKNQKSSEGILRPILYRRRLLGNLSA